MEAADLIEIARDAIVTFFKVGMPVMVIGLVIGVIISLFQALTQIQEQTLAFIPKILSIFIVLMLTLPFMADSLSSFMATISEWIIRG